MTTEEKKVPKEDELTVVDFKPGVGYVCVDNAGKKWIKRTVVSMASQVKSNSNHKITDHNGRKIHMKKKERRELKKRYLEALERQKAQKGESNGQ